MDTARKLHDEVVRASSETWWSETNQSHFDFAREREENAIRIGYASKEFDLVIGDAPSSSSTSRATTAWDPTRRRVR